MIPHPMPDNGTYKCGECDTEHRVVSRDWLLEVGFTEQEISDIMAEQARKVAGWKHRAPRSSKTGAERQREYMARKRARESGSDAT